MTSVYLHCHNFVMWQNEKEHVGSDFFTTNVVSLEELYYGLKEIYGDFYGKLIDADTGKQAGWTFIRDEEYTEIEVFLEPRVFHFSTVYPRFPSEQCEKVTTIERESVLEYQPLILPKKKQQLTRKKRR